MESGSINFNLYQSHYGKMRVLARHRLNPFTCMIQDYVYLSVVNAIRFFPSRAWLGTTKKKMAGWCGPNKGNVVAERGKR